MIRQRDRRTLRTPKKCNRKRARQERSEDLGTVTLVFKPGPDAQERLRQAFTLILAAAGRTGTIDQYDDATLLPEDPSPRSE